MAAAPHPTDAAPRASRLGRAVLTVVVVAMVAMWGYVLYLAFGPGRQPPPDRLDDATFALAAEDVCDAALADVADLPRAIEADTAADRSAIVTEANVRFDEMLDDLARLRPSGEDGELVGRWLDDWGTYIGDRQRYADNLLVDPDARLLVTARDRDQITEYIDAFAADNDMPACATPIDV
ncbi:MAG: hypothetical protein ACSLFP_14045 [Acidimicrobiales bacterium]